MALKSGHHHVFDISYHLVMTTKYRKPVFTGQIAEHVRAFLTQECARLDVDITTGHVSPEHVHLMLTIPPTIAVSTVVGKIKANTARRINKIHRKKLEETYYGTRSIWSSGYYVATVGAVIREVVEAYIQNHTEQPDAGTKFSIESEIKNLEITGV